jgi:hypothetical protein
MFFSHETNYTHIKDDFISSFAKSGIPSLGIFCRIQNFLEMPDPEYELATCSAGYL